MSEHLDYEINKELGECYLFMGELDKAEEYYKKAAGSNGIHPDPYIGLATVAVQRGALEDAMAMYKRAHKVSPTDKSFSGMALILMENGESEAAYGYFTDALEMNPENMVALFSMVRLGHEMNRLPQVVGHLENYLAIDPDKLEVRYALAGCLVCLERKDEAREQLESVLAIEPDNESARELLAQLS